jgi:hypothetical protein
MLQLSDKIRKKTEKDGKTNTRQYKKRRFIEAYWQKIARIDTEHHASKAIRGLSFFILLSANIRMIVQT